MSDSPQLQVKTIEWSEGHRDALKSRCVFRGECGDFVAVRPCGDEFEGKTFLGVMLGGIATHIDTDFERDTGTLKVGFCLHNPAMYVPDLKRVVLGRESWWGLIRSADQLRQITDADINNVWYVQALKAMGQSASSEDGAAVGVE